MTHSPNDTPDFQQWEYEQRRDKVERDFEGAYQYSPDWAVHADMVAALATDDLMRSKQIAGEDEYTGRVQLALKKVAFMFSNPGDPLDTAMVSAIAADRRCR